MRAECVVVPSSSWRKIFTHDVVHRSWKSGEHGRMDRQGDMEADRQTVGLLLL